MEISPDEKTETIRIEVPEWVKNDFKSAAYGDGNDLTEELADLIRFRANNEGAFRRADFSRPRRKR